MGEKTGEACAPVDLSDQDVLAAMREIPGYLDITPGDFKEIYRKAYELALRRLSAPRLAGEVMTREVVSAPEDMPLAEVAALMASRGVSGAPVVDDQGRVSGVLTERDFLGLMGAGPGRGFLAVVAGCLSASGCLVSHLQGKVARDVMSAPAITSPSRPPPRRWPGSSPPGA